MLRRILVLVLIGSAAFAAETKRGLVRSENTDVPVYGVMRQVGNDVQIETNEKIYVVDRTQFYASNSVAAESKTRAANYKLPTAAIKSVTKKEVGDAR